MFQFYSKSILDIGNYTIKIIATLGDKNKTFDDTFLFMLNVEQSPNSPPYFLEPLEPIVLTSGVQREENLPKFADDDKDEIIVNVNLMNTKQFIKFDKFAEKFVFQPGPGVFGSYSIAITLTDNAVPPASQIY